jgi:hypothetical protein
MRALKKKRDIIKKTWSSERGPKRIMYVYTYAGENVLGEEKI